MSGIPRSPQSVRRRNLVLGTLEQYPNATAAQKAVVALRVDINVESPRTSLAAISHRGRFFGEWQVGAGQESCFRHEAELEAGQCLGGVDFSVPEMDV